VYLLLIPLVYAVLVLSLAAVKKLGSRNSKSSLNLRRNKFKRKEDDVVNLVRTFSALGGRFGLAKGTWLGLAKGTCY